MARSKSAKVADLWVDGDWDFKFGRPFNDWEFDTIVGQRLLNPRNNDQILWKHSVDGTFSV